MSFMFPRTISVTRPQRTPVAGAGGYSALLVSTETVVNAAQHMPASIQVSRVSSKPGEHLPGDADGKPKWNIYVPLSASPPFGTVLDNDSVTDDQGRRFQVIAAVDTSLGLRILAQIEKT